MYIKREQGRMVDGRNNAMEKYYTFVGFLTTVDRILSYWYIILRNYVFITE